MRKMTEQEMRMLIKACSWASICTCSALGEPYAIEATPFHMDSLTGFMINPRGGTWRNMQHNDSVLLKYTLAAPSLRGWAGVSCVGKGRFVDDPDEIREGWRLLGLVMKQDYSQAAERFSKKPSHSPFFAVTVQSMTGRCSAAQDEELALLSMVQEEPVPA